MSEEKKESEVKDAPKETPKETKKDDAQKSIKASKVAEDAAKAAEKAQAAAEAALAKAQELKDAAKKAAEEEFKAIAEQVQEQPKGPDYTFKRKTEIIFRREMGEPEFFLDKDERFPKPILTEDEKNEITQKALNYEDTTPLYSPENILDQRYGGISNYENGITVLGDELETKLERLKNDPEALPAEIEKVEQDLKYLDSLHENYHLGMNVFRTAKGGREKLRD